MTTKLLLFIIGSIIGGMLGPSIARWWIRRRNLQCGQQVIDAYGQGYEDGLEEGKKR